MPATAMTRVRVDEDVRAQAAEARSAVGMTVSNAMRVFPKRVVVEKALPLNLRVPGAETLFDDLDSAGR